MHHLTGTRHVGPVPPENGTSPGIAHSRHEARDARWCGAIEGGTADDRVAELVAECEAAGNSSGCALDSSRVNCLRQRRQELLGAPENKA